MRSTEEFKDRVALIAGGTGTLGREVAIDFLAAGAHTITTYHDRAEFDELAAEAERAGLRAPVGVVLEATDLVAVEKTVQGLAEQFGRLDILINAVGGYSGGKKVWEEDAASYQRMMTLNLLSGFSLARAILPIMIKQNRGWIVNVASRAGLTPSPDAALYAASKAAALALFESLAAEVKSHAINVNSVVPSIFDSPANRRAMPSADFKLWPQPAEIADVIFFLCSEEARLIHGAAIPVYGRS